MLSPPLPLVTQSSLQLSTSTAPLPSWPFIYFNLDKQVEKNKKKKKIALLSSAISHPIEPSPVDKHGSAAILPPDVLQGRLRFTLAGQDTRILSKNGSHLFIYFSYTRVFGDFLDTRYIFLFCIGRWTRRKARRAWKKKKKKHFGQWSAAQCTPWTVQNSHHDAIR